MGIETPTTEITFTIVPNRDVTATFLAHWGTSSHYEQFAADEGVAQQDSPFYIKSGETVEVNFGGSSNQGGNQLGEASEIVVDDPTPDPSTEPDVPTVTPSKEPIEPSEEPIEPSEEPVEPSEEPVEPSEEPVEPVVHIVGRGQTLSSISRLYGVSVDRIIAYNGITDPDMIITGSKILIPPADWQMPAEA